MKLTVDMPMAGLQRRLEGLPRDMRVAAAQALNTTVLQAQLAQVDEMRAVFDRPTPWALGGVTHDKATPASLEAVVRIRGRTGSGGAIPAESFLRAQILGGVRRWKRFEVALFKAGVLPAGYFAVPGSGARMDAYGNMAGAHISQLLSYFQAYPPGSTGRRQNTTAERRARLAETTRRRQGYAYVAIKPGNRNLYPGIYEYRDLGGLGTGVRAVLIFVRRAQYRALFDFKGAADKAIERQLPVQWAREMEQAAGPGGQL